MSSDGPSSSSRVIGGRTLRNGPRKCYASHPIESSDDENQRITTLGKLQASVMMQPSEVVVKTEESAGEDTQPSRKRRKGSSEVDDFGISRKQQKQREAKLKIQKIRARAEAKAQAERRRQEQDRQREDERNLKIYQARVEKELKWKKQHAKPNMPWRSGQSLHLFDLPAEVCDFPYEHLSQCVADIGRNYT